MLDAGYFLQKDLFIKHPETSICLSRRLILSAGIQKPGGTADVASVAFGRLLYFPHPEKVCFDVFTFLFDHCH
ncbi:MAG: hypothetical protein KKE59_05995, partial [Proteobacteria bacterium]|nr:hypothetical protein [Pseudomonadota bacterium]